MYGCNRSINCCDWHCLSHVTAQEFEQALVSLGIMSKITKRRAGGGVEHEDHGSRSIVDRRPTGGSCQGFERGRANTKCHTQT